MSPWKLLTTNQGKACALDNASIRWTNVVGSYHGRGRVEIHQTPEVTGLFRIFIDGMVVQHALGGPPEVPVPLRHCIYLPTDGGMWKVSTGRKKSLRRPNYKVFALAVEFPPNTDGISFVQVCIEVFGTEDLSKGERFAEAITYANTILDRRLLPTNNSA
jgi:hypothetical protein